VPEAFKHMEMMVTVCAIEDLTWLRSTDRQWLF